MKKVTDPKLLAELEGRINYDFKDPLSPEDQLKLDADATAEAFKQLKKVTDPQLLAELNGVEANFDPTEGMTTGDNLLAGIGKGFVDTGRGVKQLLNIGDQDQLTRDIEESRNLDKPLMDTGAGATGNVLGNIAATAPAMFIPGANTLVGGSLIGASMGGLSPSLDTSETLTNMGIGGVGGGLGVVAGRVLPTVANAFIAPFTGKGREKIAGNVLRESVGDDVAAAIAKLKNPEIFVDGSTPNSAEVLLNPKLATLLKAVRNLPEGKEAIVGKEISNNAARLAAIRSVAQDEAAIMAANEARTQATKGLYDNLPFVQSNDELQKILSTPAGQKAITKAREYAGNQYRTFGEELPGPIDAKGYFGTDIHQVQRGLKSVASDPAIDPVSRQSVGGVLDDFNNWIANKAPDIHAANKAYAEASKPINQMEVGHALKNKLTPALTESGLPTRERANMFAEAIRNQRATVKKSTGMNQSLEDVMTPEQMKVISGISKDLERKANASDLSAARGSDTAQNLIADNMLSNIVGPIGMPKSWATKAVTNALINSLPRRAIDIALPGVERKVQGVLADAMVDPTLAARLLEQTDKKSKIAELLYRSAMSLGTQGALSAN